jgi:NADPH:quinone reductase-like Zn-dependent oxidoreductase
MKAVVYEKYGSPDVLEVREVEKPAPKDDEVLVRIHAVSINDWDWALLPGTPLVTRLMSGLFSPRQTILGCDIAGRIEAIGKNVKRFKPGDEVFGDLSPRFGGFAEYACAPETSLALKPPAMSFVEAAAIPQAAMLAVQGLLDRGGIQSGQKVLINGAGGGVGTFALQIAKLYGVEVTGVDSSAKLDFMRSLGFDKVIDYTQEDFTRSGIHYDLILDVKTNRSVFDYARALSPNGTYVTVGGSLLRLLQVVFLAPLISLVSRKAMRLVVLKQNKDLAYMSELFEAGKVKPVIDKLRKLSEVTEAMRYFGAGRHKGKVVITLDALLHPFPGDVSTSTPVPSASRNSAPRKRKRPGSGSGKQSVPAERPHRAQGRFSIALGEGRSSSRTPQSRQWSGIQCGPPRCGSQGARIVLAPRSREASRSRWCTRLQVLLLEEAAQRHRRMW